MLFLSAVGLKPIGSEKEQKRKVGTTTRQQLKQLNEKQPDFTTLQVEAEVHVSPQNRSLESTGELKYIGSV